VPVVFSVLEGGGSFGGAQSLSVNSDSDGRAQAVLTLGPEEGIANNMATAAIDAPGAAAATFIATGQYAGNPADTSVSGVVLDNTNLPIAGVTVGIEDLESLTRPRALLFSTLTDDQGRFRLQPVPVGEVVLQVEGATAARPGVWPRLEYDLVTVPGRDNTVGMPIYLLPIDVDGGLAIDDTHGGTITLPHVPGFSLTVAPGSVTFLDGTTRGTVSVTSVHPDKVPMVPNFGQQPRFVVTIQPAGVHFNPPAPMTIPNVDGLPPGTKTEMYSFDHDLGQFVSIGPGTVSEDGSIVRSDPGVGVIKGGWHSAGPPASVGNAGVCSDGNDCTEDALEFDFTKPNSAPRCVSTPVDNGTLCGGPVFLDRTIFHVSCEGKAVNLEIDPSCQGFPGVCLAGRCTSDTQFNVPAIRDAATDAIGKLCESSCVNRDILRKRMLKCLRNYGLKVLCSAASSGAACAEVPNFGAGHCAAEPDACTRQMRLYPSAMDTCGIPLEATLLHEMVHSHGCEFGSSTHNETPDQYDRVYGCQESCYPGSTGGRGRPDACWLP
jgi:hypothetical protein